MGLEMFGWLHRVPVVFGLVCVLANAACYSRCMIISFGLSESPQSSHDERGCHHGKPLTPGPERTPCSHHQIATGLADQVATNSVQQAVQLAAYVAAPPCFYVPDSGPVGSADLSPPTFRGIVQSSILRI